ncbi:hypothetical protein NDK47_24245 [Brevibacillus ruminantium]|uniref:Uncharacterized protein n=1 Tax=Brevibacillus ruminantium TaxID=2950604 RepID=A0ABY4WDQ6_9BACL|nr:hypothetical protein [Brevibacillus ruminantium]USG65197.1 hypothetical protein NDK47_24245 [Brevibacillus ruminantium]
MINLQVDYLGKQYTAVGIAKSTVLPEEFILLQGHGEYLVAPTHDLSGLRWNDDNTDKQVNGAIGR